MSFAHNCILRLRVLLGQPDAMLAHGEALARREAHQPAFALFARAARAGRPQAQFRLGRCYLLGLGVPANLREAVRWLTKAAEAGEPAAQTEVAALALRGIADDGFVQLFRPAGDTEPAPDFQRAEYFSRRAAAAGSADAKALLGLILTVGPPHLRDPAAGEACYRESAQAGCHLGAFGLAVGLLRDGTRDSAIQARGLLRRSAEAGAPMAHYLLGMLAESGAAGSVELDAAAHAYKQAAELGFAPAQLRYGLAALYGRGTPRDAFTAETWLRRAAMAGEAHAAAAIGDLYASDDTANYAEASIWYTRAAERGHAGSARALGRLYRDGKGVRQDPAVAAHWLRLAIHGGDELARDDMARLVLARQAGAEDAAACIAWFRSLAEAGNPGAQFNLGLCLAEGIGGKTDEAAALRWFRRAAAAMPAAEPWIEALSRREDPAGSLRTGG
jgi:TPR repeat protein